MCGSDMSTTFTLLLPRSAMTSFSSCVLTMETIQGFSTSSSEAGVTTNTLCGVAVITSTARGGGGGGVGVGEGGGGRRRVGGGEGGCGGGAGG